MDGIIEQHITVLIFGLKRLAWLNLKIMSEEAGKYNGTFPARCAPFFRYPLGGACTWTIPAPTMPCYAAPRGDRPARPAPRHIGFQAAGLYDPLYFHANWYSPLSCHDKEIVHNSYYVLFLAFSYRFAINPKVVQSLLCDFPLIPLYRIAIRYNSL